MKVLWGLMVLIVLLLQTRLWFGEGSFAEVAALREAVAQQKAGLLTLKERNRRLDRDVLDLKDGTAAIEERARMTLGMIGKDETFYMVVGTAK
jgi:cell division protein FtsB